MSLTPSAQQSSAAREHHRQVRPWRVPQRTRMIRTNRKQVMVICMISCSFRFKHVKMVPTTANTMDQKWYGAVQELSTCRHTRVSHTLDTMLLASVGELTSQVRPPSMKATGTWLEKDDAKTTM